MPERFFDPDFTTRIVRLLQLRGGRAPQFVSDEVVPVFDLTALLARAPSELPIGMLEPRPAEVVNGLYHARYYGPNLGGGVGFTMCLQWLNPAGSNILTIIDLIKTVGISTRVYNGRFYDTPLTTLQANRGINLRADRGTALTEIRQQAIAIAGFPPAGMSGPVFMDSQASSGGNLLDAAAVVLAPGKGFIVHEANAPPGGGADPAPLDNGAVVAYGRHMEVSFAL